MPEIDNAPRVVGIAGPKEVGKTTAGTMLRETSGLEGRHFDLSDPIVAMVNILLDRAEDKKMPALPGEDPLFDSISEEVAQQEVDKFIERGYAAEAWDPITHGVITRQLLGHAITLETKPKFRPILEHFGKAAIQYFGESYWSDMVIQRANQLFAQGAELLTIGSIRYPDNAHAIRSLGGRVVRLRRGEHTHVLPTEEALYEWKADYRIDNDGTLDDLRRKVDLAWETIKNDVRPLGVEPAEELLIE